MNYGIGSSCLIVYSLDRCTPAGRNFFLKKVREEGNKKKIDHRVDFLVEPHPRYYNYNL